METDHSQTDANTPVESPPDLKTLSRRTTVARWTTLAGYFGLLIVLLNWFTWISPPTRFPRAFLLIALVVPLLFPLRGLLHGRTYTHSWTSFLSLLYFAVGIDIAFNNTTDRALALAVVGFSLLLFLGSVFYAYYEKRRRHMQESISPEKEPARQTPATDS